MPDKTGCWLMNLTLFQPMWGTFSPGGSSLALPCTTPRQGASPSSVRSINSCRPRQTPKNGFPEAM